MFDIGWSELLLIGVVALIAIGPKELPGVLRAVGQWTGKMRRMAAEFQGQFQEALREAEMADLKKQVDELNDAARSIATYDPLAETAKSIAAPTPITPPADTTASPDTPAVTAEPLPAPEGVAPAAAVESPVPEAPVTTPSTEPVAGAAVAPAEVPPAATPVPAPVETVAETVGEAAPTKDRPA
ncbi:Sec-independent protein translocase protein TatB [Rhodoplanes sp. SY1]|uniref:Sec-independent protein translocase protein TatB n=1 Tax=Rhodoplanes sp. SY1 TaxID=3166646 RepID=UPI0038B61672